MSLFRTLSIWNTINTGRLEMAGEMMNCMSVELNPSCLFRDCPNHNSFEACRGGATSNPKCIWCEIANTCITRSNKDDHDFKENGCRNKSSIVEVSSEPTTVATTETDLGNELKGTSGSTESHLIITTDTKPVATTETDLGNELKETNPSTESHLIITTDTKPVATTETDLGNELKETNPSTESHLVNI
ncbi:unnamed protein product [Schistosoma mattheei]|uniref:Uncharacterized protein n=1 Tax=Schistosoma mattheei TaxID=31246 RepID=A0A183PUV3_9TREM|nr:unnamed protein product [Schistosoma mattheei]